MLTKHTLKSGSLRVELAHWIFEMRPIPRTARIRKFATTKLGQRHESMPPGFTPFVILTTQRSGSSLLDERLSACWTDVRSDGEIFNPRHRGNRTFEETLDRTYLVDTGHRIVGCKVIRSQVTDSELESLLRLPGIHVVVLRRGNILRQFVSLKIAEKDEIWKQPAHTSRSDVRGRAVEIGIDEVLLYAEHQNQTYGEFEELTSGMPVNHMSYEALTADLDAELVRLGEFLGTGHPNKSLPLKFLHQNPEPLRELISNFETLKSDLESSGHTRLLDMLDT
jgi:LPS sulfotransferase NodH